MLFYEAERSDRRDYLYCQRDHDLNFPAHLHQSLELLCVQAGTLICELEGEPWPVRAGQALLILPNRIHSYRTDGHAESVLWVFSEDWVPEFTALLGQREFASPVFSIEAAPLMELLWPESNRCQKLAGLYLACGAALEQCPLRASQRESGDRWIGAQIIDYVQKHYTGELTLDAMARDLGYNYTYLSACFTRQLHMGFFDFVNSYRVDHAAALLQGSNLPVTQIARQCGFGTIRSFNRVFLRAKGVSPSAFRKQYREQGG